MSFGVSSAAIEERATRLLAACESCLVVTRIPGADMSFRRIMERKCPRCGGTLVLPQEVMEMLILYGHFVPESVAVTLVLGTMVLHPSLRADFMASAMNELLIPLQTDCVYDVAVPKRPEGLGMSLRMHQGALVVGGFIDFENNSESPSVAARIIAVEDVLVAINKKSIASWSFEKSIRMLAHAASPVYLTFRRRQPVILL
ncbi:hypothetical protein BBO99_00007089 [Phytophthora kernoviae]|nr:hypothetical protein BBJ29_008343 [Phytophthora kernoviae]RLN53987.1 hypothetical protein BBP00_00009113 [Phytophthora kernoviae]RLN76999.1 hypothetical protein BBO99_00007089 [Phytophthora kernoviae]